MGFFRNPEVKKHAAIYAFITLAVTAAGFSYDTAVGIGAAAVCLIFDAMAYFISRGRYKKIAALSDEIDRILHGNESYDLDQFSEGELSILQSELVKMTVRLREQAEQLSADKLALADSLADITHQIKTPLTSINLAMALLAEPNLSHDGRLTLIRDVSRSLSRIEWLISSLLKISRLDAGAVELRKDRIKVSDVIKNAASPLAIPMELRSQSLHVEYSGELTFTGDLAWSTEALSNVLKNCVEHTPDGGDIWVSSRGTAIFTEISVRDSGEGFSDEDLPHLFERFYRGRNSTEQSIGIGLALSRMIITRQNGSITAENSTSGGALFKIRFYKGTV